MLSDGFVVAVLCIFGFGGMLVLTYLLALCMDCMTPRQRLELTVARRAGLGRLHPQERTQLFEEMMQEQVCTVMVRTTLQMVSSNNNDTR